MQSLKAETDNLFGSINRYEELAIEANKADEHVPPPHDEQRHGRDHHHVRAQLNELHYTTAIGLGSPWC